MNKYFSLSKTAKLRLDISTFTQFETESFSEAWDRFKELCRKCPHHGLEIWEQVNSFYRGLLPSAREVLDAVAGGLFAKKYSHEAYQLLEDMAESNVHWHSDRQNHKRPSGVFGMEALTTLTAQMEAMNRKIEALAVTSFSNSPSVTCELCGGPHAYSECPQGNASIQFNESANFVAGNFRNNQFGNTYHPGFRNHPNLSWKSQNVQNQCNEHISNQQDFSNNCHKKKRSQV